MNLVLSLLLLTATSAWAEWTQIGTSDNWDAYVDFATIRKKGNMVKMWLLKDYATAQTGALPGRKFLSSKSLDEYDCEEGQSRTLYFSWHTKSMGGGLINYEFKEPSGWTPVPPGSWAETFWNIACKQ